MGLYRYEPAKWHSLYRRDQRYSPPRWEHREGIVEGFTKRYGLKRLVYVERYDDIRLAIQREKNLKHWPRAWKIRLILSENLDWNDLYDRLV